MTRRQPASTPGPSYPQPLRALRPPPIAQEIVARLERAGFEAWCVGGAVRDALLGHPHSDWDFATSATPTEVMRVFKRTVPVGAEFGTVGVLDGDNVMHEVTTFRRDVRTDGRHAVVAFGVSLEEDLARRDFTINAMAFHPARAELRDPFDGQGDLQRGIVRAVGVPSQRLAEDHLRALRAIRFASRFGFHIHPETWAAVVAAAPLLSRLSPERVHQELEKTMQQVERPGTALEWWRAAGALGVLVPLIADAPGERFEALDHLPRGAPDAAGRGATLNRLAMLFFGDAPARVESACRDLRFSNSDVAWIAALASARAELGAGMDAALSAGMPSAEMIRRWVARVGRTRTHAFAELTVALWKARLAHELPEPREPDEPHEPHEPHESRGEFTARMEAITAMAVHAAHHDAIEVADLAIDGDDLRGVGVGPGPAVGRVLRDLLGLVIADPALNVRETLLALARERATLVDS